MTWSHTAVALGDASRVALARREAAAVAQAAGLDEHDAGRVALVVTELATNLVKHATSGQRLLVRKIGEQRFASGVEVLALDSGPGLADVERWLADGRSTAGSLGIGLGSVRRAADLFDVYSAPGQGTAVLARVWPSRAAPQSSARFTVGAVGVPKPGESACGDAWAVDVDAGRSTARVLVADGLGHGPMAAQAAGVAVSTFERRRVDGTVDILRALHDALRSTRGAAASVAAVDAEACVVRYAGVGNVSAMVWTGDTPRVMVAHNGTLGLDVCVFREFQYPWTPGSLLVVSSDGLSTRMTLAPYAGLRRHHPALIASVLYRDFARGADDATVVVVREEP